MRKILMLVCLMACSSETQSELVEQPINNGFKPGFFYQTVFLVSDTSHYCSGTNVRYPRCIVTAAHCLDNPDFVGAGQTPLVGNSKKQSVRKMLRRAVSPWTDLGVEWLEAKLPGSQDRMVTTTDYVPMGLGLATAPATLFRKSTELYTTSGLPLSAVIVGYGQDGHGGKAAQAIGVPNITAFHQGVLQSTPQLGSIIRVEPNNGLHQIGCEGDSGGPIWPAGSGWATYGVLSTAASEACPSEYTHYTAFDDASFNGEAGNRTWTSDAMERICTQWLNVKIEGQGSVAGDILPKQRKNFDVESNDRIDCPGDCIEDFHQLDSPEHRPPQIMNIVATPSQGWRFLEWRSESIQKKCQCKGSSDPSCWVKQQPMGYYTQTDSIDEDTCIAVFVQDNDGGGYDSGMDDSGPNDSGSDASDAGTDSPLDADDASDSSDGGVDAADED